MSVIDSLLKDYNELRGKKYPDVGYAYFADVRGDGSRIRSVYTIINTGGGVTYSELNGKSYNQTAANIRAAIVDYCEGKRSTLC